ncbi:MAG: hypothetical protein C4520_09525 [Candidatus Abyssobacteria bacterium SURF_5]|uniref:Peptidase C45 hydrolase domain-containing protein n=1 Tax=Abyssobacteria bacterium (strain SURF_5) TaxID=2093360 RepID=A0A3A4NM00_ABYX5|nr:MAG: hypothetical protein C4520_09525 [Candidatus Abyssubacteria bacterium SURF_5]
MIGLITLFVLLVGFILIFLIHWPLGDGRAYLPNSEEMRWLESTSVVEDERGRKAFGRATLEVRGGLNVLRLCGSHYEMGYQHGVLLKDEIREGALLFYAAPAEHFPPFKHKRLLARWLIARFFDWSIYRRLLKNSPREYLAELKGIADGSGLSFADVFRGNMLSDLNMNLIKVLEKKALRKTGDQGCTSFAAFGGATTDGKLLMGRNTDYTGVGLWDKHQTVVFYEPENAYRFVSVSSAGLIKCNSCMNEKGLCLGAHFLFLNDTIAEGVSFTFLEMDIMKKASSVEEALALVSERPRAGAFAFLVADGKANDAVVIEASALEVGFRYAENGLLWETNMATTDKIKPFDVFLRNNIGKNPIARFERMRMLLNENRGKIDSGMAARFMGDHMDMCSDSLRPVGGIISQVINITSAVFSPASFDFWVADGPAPVCNNTYVGFNLMDELAESPSRTIPQTLAPNEYAQSRNYQGLRTYCDALMNFVIPGGDENAVLPKLEEAIALCPDEAIYRRLAGIYLLSQWDASAAASQLTAALECVQSPNERAQTILLLGFANDLQGNRNEALKLYQQVLDLGSNNGADILSAVNQFVLADAKKYLHVPYTVNDTKDLELNFEIVGKYDL